MFKTITNKKQPKKKCFNVYDNVAYLNLIISTLKNHIYRKFFYFSIKLQFKSSKTSKTFNIQPDYIIKF